MASCTLQELDAAVSLVYLCNLGWPKSFEIVEPTGRILSNVMDLITSSCFNRLLVLHTDLSVDGVLPYHASFLVNLNVLLSGGAIFYIYLLDKNKYSDTFVWPVENDFSQLQFLWLSKIFFKQMGHMLKEDLQGR